jgi:hypothetical protein
MCLKWKQWRGFADSWCFFHLDVSGGYSTSILNAIRSALQTSIHILFEKSKDSNYVPLSYHEAFYLATLGGAKGWWLKALLTPSIYLTRLIYLEGNVYDMQNKIFLQF